MPRKPQNTIEKQQKLNMDSLKQELKDLLQRIDGMPNKPAYSFKAGESVRVGNLPDCIIKEKYNNYIYLIEYTNVVRQFGVETAVGRVLRYVLWIDIRPICTPKPRISKPDDLRLSYNQTTLECLIHRVYHFGVNFNPSYQRDYVWSAADKEALLESIFTHVDIGKFLFNYVYADKYGYEIVDGKQRLSTLIEFFEDKITYKGVHYSELCKEDRYIFDNYTVCYADLRYAEEKDVLRYFIRVNTTGRTMSKKHLQEVKNRLASM